MSAKLYAVRLSEAEGHSLKTLLRTGVAEARVLTRARVFLLADEGHTDQQIVAALGIALVTVHRLRQRLATEGLAAALQEKPRPGCTTEAQCSSGGTADRPGML